MAKYIFDSLSELKEAGTSQFRPGDKICINDYVFTVCDNLPLEDEKRGTTINHLVLNPKVIKGREVKCNSLLENSLNCHLTV